MRKLVLQEKDNGFCSDGSPYVIYRVLERTNMAEPPIGSFLTPVEMQSYVSIALSTQGETRLEVTIR